MTHLARCSLHVFGSQYTAAMMSAITMEAFEELDVLQLKEYLAGKKNSSKTLECLASQMVSGLSLTLLSDEDMKEVIPMLGDRVIVRNIIRNLKQVSI